MTDKSPPPYGPPPGQGPYDSRPPHQEEPSPNGYQPQQSGSHSYAQPYQPSFPPPSFPPPGQPSGQQAGQFPGRPPAPPQHPAPPHGYGPSPYGPSAQYGQPPRYGPPRQVDPRAVRPKLWWIAVAWAVALVCGLTGGFLFVRGMSQSTGQAPTRTFTSGETVTVTLDPADPPALYLSSDTAVEYDCQIGGGARLIRSPGTWTHTAQGVTWEQFLLVNVPAAGRYQLTCVTPQQPGTRFGVGRAMSAATGGALGGVAALLLLPAAGVLGATAATVVVLVRRNGHRKRLTAGG